MSQDPCGGDLNPTSGSSLSGTKSCPFLQMVQLLSYCKAVLTENQRINMHLHSLGVAAPPLETLNNPLPAALTASLGGLCEAQGSAFPALGSASMPTGAAMPSRVDAGSLGSHMGVRGTEASWHQPSEGLLQGCLLTHCCLWRPCCGLHPSSVAAAGMHPHRCCCAWSRCLVPVTLCAEHGPCLPRHVSQTLQGVRAVCSAWQAALSSPGPHPGCAVPSAEPVCCVQARASI